VHPLHLSLGSSECPLRSLRLVGSCWLVGAAARPTSLYLRIDAFCFVPSFSASENWRYITSFHPRNSGGRKRHMVVLSPLKITTWAKRLQGFGAVDRVRLQNSGPSSASCWTPNMSRRQWPVSYELKFRHVFAILKALVPLARFSLQRYPRSSCTPYNYNADWPSPPQACKCGYWNIDEKWSFKSEGLIPVPGSDRQMVESGPNLSRSEWRLVGGSWCCVAGHRLMNTRSFGWVRRVSPLEELRQDWNACWEHWNCPNHEYLRPGNENYSDGLCQRPQRGFRPTHWLSQNCADLRLRNGNPLHTIEMAFPTGIYRPTCIMEREQWYQYLMYGGWSRAKRGPNSTSRKQHSRVPSLMAARACLPIRILALCGLTFVAPGGPPPPLPSSTSLLAGPSAAFFDETFLLPAFLRGFFFFSSWTSDFCWLPSSHFRFFMFGGDGSVRVDPSLPASVTAASALPWPWQAKWAMPNSWKAR